MIHRNAARTGEIVMFYDADAVIGKKNFTSSSVTAAAGDNVGQPYGVAAQSSTGKLLVSCYSNAKVLRFQAKSAVHP